MKVEMGESLLYSWLRHIKECQITQTNWKASSQWSLKNIDDLRDIILKAESYFSSKHNFSLFKGLSLEQTLKQAEIDVVGVSFSSGSPEIFAVDVAFHEGGLNYGSKAETLERVSKKFIRTALCLYGYFDILDGEIIFATPKINNAELLAIDPVINELDTLMQDLGFRYHTQLIANGVFEREVLNPVLERGTKIADTSELFLRSYQLCQMFNKGSSYPIPQNNHQLIQKTPATKNAENDLYPDMKIGRIANTILRSIIQSGKLPEDEILKMQTVEYSKRTFDIQYPALVHAEKNFEKIRYYSDPILLKGEKFFLCSQWYETPANDDRSYLLSWIRKWSDIIS